MLAITAKAALLFLRIDHVSFAINGGLCAGCGHIRHHTCTEQIISSIHPIYSLSIVLGIIVHLAIDPVLGSVVDEGLIEGNLE